jgi:transposase
MRPEGSPAELERRRLRGLSLVKLGYSLNEVARRIGCDASSVMRWRDAFACGGEQALRPRPAPGRPPRLTRRQKARLVTCLLRGPLAHGYRTDLWTTLRVAQLIRRKFGVRYHRDHVGRLLHALGFTCQKPQKRATQRDEAAIEAWKRREWPRIKKTRRGWVPISPSPMNPATC